MSRSLLLTALLLPSTFASAAELNVTPATVELRDAYTGRQLLVAQGEKDVTRSAHYTSDNPSVVHVDERGYLTPASDGEARIDITLKDARAAVRVSVKGCK